MKSTIKASFLLTGLLLLNNTAVHAGQSENSSWKGYAIGTAIAVGTTMAAWWSAKRYLQNNLPDAAKNGLLHTLKTAIALGVIEAGDALLDGDMLLLTAIKHKQPAFVQALLDAGVRAQCIHGDGLTPLHYAVKSGDVATVNALIGAGANKEAKDSSGLTPLQHAVQSGNADVVNFLIFAGADKEAQDRLGLTLLKSAAQLGHLQVLMALIQHGANSLNAIYYAAQSGNVKAVRYLLKFNIDGDKERALYGASEIGQTKVIRYLLERGGVNINVPCGFSKASPLHYAIEAGNTESIQLLTSSGANIHATDAYGRTPLHYAVESKNAQIKKVQILEMLIAAGASVNAIDPDHPSPLNCAIRLDNTEILKILIAAGADVNAIDSDGHTPPYYAVWFKRAEIMKILIAAGANVDATDNNGNTQLHNIALHSTGIEMVHILIELGANREAKNNLGQTPFDRAKQSRKYNYAKELIARGAQLPNDLTGLSDQRVTELQQIREGRLRAITEYYKASEQTANLPKDLHGLLLEFHGANTDDKIALGLTQPLPQRA